MSDAGRAVLVFGLLIAAAIGLGRAYAPSPLLGEPRAAPPCEVAVERAGVGVACLSTEQALAAGLTAGTRLAGDGRRERMSPSRIALFEVPIDPNTAGEAELASLPGIGPGLAARIAAARPFSTVEDVGRVTGLGARRLRALRARLILPARAEGEPVPVEEPD